MRVISVLIITLVLLTGTQLNGATYDIPHNGISDHSSSAITGSIAWYFATYPSSGNVFNLTSNADYYISQPLTMPAGVTLNDSAGNARIVADDGLNDNVMIFFNNNCTITNLELFANRKARFCLHGNGKSGLWLENCTLHQTKNDYTSGDPSPHLIYMPNNANSAIVNNLLRRAGCDPKLNGANWGGEASLIYATFNNILALNDNDAAYALAAGFQIFGSANVGITGNIIQHTGLNWDYLADPSGHVADGITSYHSPGGGGPYTARSNTIRYYRNHGIHLAGDTVKIENNNIYSGWHCAIYLGDQKSPHECSVNCRITGNYLKNGSQPTTNECIHLNYVDRATLTISGNTGDGTIYWGPDC
ncbi:MAG: hypothetical protein A2Y10_19995 [Planctomycetes bacterium GWF2_41_51]|nr:MAG: hypothetical protein A2Y10_19995 [Planctomycetes bacterium GWF2_41_51]HBG28570.1 hypothetical protein [Phycisphaerales bacterium]